MSVYTYSFSKPKKTKDAKEAVVEEENLEKTIEESYPNDADLSPSATSQSFHEYWRNESKQVECNGSSTMEVSNASIRTLIPKTLQG